jgi:hypothetical protein
VEDQQIRDQALTVQDLIELLSDCDPSLQIRVGAWSGGSNLTIDPAHLIWVCRHRDAISKKVTNFVAILIDESYGEEA